MKKLKYPLAIILIFALAVTSLVPSFAEIPPPEEEVVIAAVPDDEATPAAPPQSRHERARDAARGSKFDTFDIEDETLVTAIVILDENGTIDVDRNVRSARAKRAENAMRSRQSGFVSGLRSRMKVTLLSQYTVLLNGLGIQTAYKNLRIIEEMEGVQGVYLSNTYSLPETKLFSVQSHAYTNMVGADWMHLDESCNGDGLVIALLDTGLRLTHEAFADYGLAKKPALSQADVAAIDTHKPGKWISNRIPFAYDYAGKDGINGDDDVTPTNDHGTHVAGIAAGFARSGGLINFFGVAPAAQLLIMKVFADGKDTTGSTVSYFSALDDAIRLGADVVNLSLGSVNGFTYDDDLEVTVFRNIYKKLRDAGIVVTVAAGNAGTMGAQGLNPVSRIPGREAVYSDYVDYGTVGSPASYNGNLAVASMECYEYPMTVLFVAGEQFSYTDSGPASFVFIDRFAGQTLDYVMIPNVGNPSDFDLVKSQFLGKEKWVAVIERGDITFKAKMVNAANAGASAVIIYNTADKLELLDIDNFSIPTIFVTSGAGAALEANAARKLLVPQSISKFENENKDKMSTFSSRGTTSDLRLKPQITAPGGMINSASWKGDDLYLVNGGTSMAAPNVAGALACLMQYTDKNYNDEYLLGDADCNGTVDAADAAKILRSLVRLDTLSKRGTIQADITQDGIVNAADAAFILRCLVRLETLPGYKKAINKSNRAEMAEALALSTAHLIADPQEVGGLYSPRLQGAGLISLSNAARANAYIEDPLLELGDDKVKSGQYNLSFTVVNLTDVPQSYKVTPKVFRDDAKSEVDGEYYNSLSVTAADFTFITAGSPGNIVTVPAEGRLTVNVTVTLTNAEKSKLNNMLVFPNGTFVEGFVLLEPTGSGETIHATFLAFYGDWTKQPILEAKDFGDVINEKAAGRDYLDTLRLNVGFNEAWVYSSARAGLGLLGENILSPVAYDGNRNAISGTGNNAASGVSNTTMMAYPMQLRNARRVIMTVANAGTGEIYNVDDTPYLRKAHYYYIDDEKVEKAYITHGYFEWDGRNAAGQLVPSNTKVIVRYYAWLDYEKDIEAAFQALKGDYAKLATTPVLAAKKVWEYLLTVDRNPPVITSVTVVGGQLRVIATDNQFVMGATLKIGEDTQSMGVGADGAITFALVSGELELTVYDYARNSSRQVYAYDATTGDLTRTS